MSIQARARELYDAFVTDKRLDGTEFVKLQDGSPEWMKDLCRAAHGEMFPDDFRYAMIEEMASKIADSNEDADMDDVRCEIEADIYTSDLTAWLASRTDRYGYVDEAVEEMGWPDSGLTQALQMGQVREKEEVFEAVRESLEKLEEVEA